MIPAPVVPGKSISSAVEGNKIKFSFLPKFTSEKRHAIMHIEIWNHIYVYYFCTNADNECIDREGTRNTIYNK